MSYEKSGRTWLRVMLSRYYQIRCDLDENQLLNYDKMHTLHRSVPTILFTHNRYLKHDGGEIVSILERSPNKVILLVRDPRDVAVSMYFHWKYRMKERNRILDGLPPSGTDLTLYDFVVGQDTGLIDVIEFMNRWQIEHQRTDRVVMFRYEELRADTAGQLRKVLATLGEQPGEAEIEESVAYASFDNMLAREKNGDTTDSRLRAVDPNNPDSFKTRRGKVGGYHDYFDAEQLAEINRIVQTRLNPVFGY